MPPYRRRVRCIGYDEPQKPKRAAARKRSEMTEDEKFEADTKRLVRKAVKEAKTEWEKGLKPWKENIGFILPVGTMAMYKSDAKSAFGLSDKDMDTLPHESTQNSPKTFFALKDVRKPATEKWDAGALPLEFLVPGEPKGDRVRLFKKSDHAPNRRVRTNWSELGTDLWPMVKMAYLKEGKH